MMKEQLLTFHFTKDFVPFLDLFLTEEQLDDIIFNCSNISILYTSLKVKYYYVLHGRQQKIAFPLRSIFNELSSSNLDEICNVLELSLLVQDVNLAALSYLEYVCELCEKGEDAYVVLKLLSVIINIHCYLKLKLPDCFTESVVQNLLIEVFNSHSNLLRNLFCKVLEKYIECISDVENILRFILSLKDLYTISCCFNIFICHKDLIRNKFWLMIIENFNSSNYNRKLSLNILKQYIGYVSKYKKFNEELDIIKGNIQNNKQFIKSWNNYFLLTEVSQEKSLHLVTPALKLMPTVAVLHPSWLSCLYKFFLHHPQNSVAFSASKNILMTDIIYNTEFLKNIIHSLLLVLNKYEYSENYFELFKEFKNFSHTLDDSLYCILFKESLKIRWSPISAWYFYSNIVEDANKAIQCSLIMNVLNNVKGIPHAFIRSNCYIIVLNFLVKQKYFSSLTLSKFIKLAVEMKKCDEALLLIFYQCAHNNIKLYNQNINTEIFIILHDSSADEIEIFFQIIRFNSRHSLFLKNILLPKFFTNDIAIYLVFYLCKYHPEQFNVFEYLEQELQNRNCNKDINMLCKITELVQQISVNLSFMEKCKFIIMNSAQYNQNNITLAFKIYSSNIDNDVGNIVKIWNNKLLNGDKIQNRICKYYLNVCFSYLRNSHNIANNFEQNYDVIVRIFDTQSEDVWLEIYENFEILLRYYNHRQRLEFLERLFEELGNFGNYMIKAWSLLIKTILRNVNILTEENIKDLILLKITQFSMTNDFVANVFISELLSATEKCSRLFINLIMDFIFYGGIIKKDKRCEYAACKNIDFIVNTTIKNNPNYIHTNIRTTAINVVLRILNETGQDTYGDFLCKLCLQRYRQYFRKRYFPDSEIHLSKLRSLQLLFVLLPYVSNPCKADIIDFIIESICLESHQPCVRQLMQWLLVVLLINDPDRTAQIFERMDKPEDNHISVILTFIPVLYHIGVNSDEKFIEKSIRVLLKWTMGAHFKLRLYSQIVIMKLIEVCIKKQYIQIVSKYDALYKSIKDVLELTGSSVGNTLQTDKAFLDQLSVDKHYDLHLIYKGIPQLNNVLETEWEYIDLELITHNKYIATKGTVIDLENVARSIRIAPDSFPLDVPVNNIQKKILPSQDLKITSEDQTKQNCTTELILVATLIESGANLGGFARTCEIYGVKEFVISDRKIVAGKEFKSLSMTSENWVNIIEVKHNALASYLDKVKEDGYVIVGVEQTQESFKLHNYTFPKKCALVLGNEKEGIPPHLFPFLDVCVEIPQFGLLRSLNVHVAGAIVVWEYVKQNML